LEDPIAHDRDRLIANLNLAATGPNHHRELAVFKQSFGARNAVAVALI
jgi:hypothetical protein